MHLTHSTGKSRGIRNPEGKHHLRAMSQPSSSPARGTARLWGTHGLGYLQLPPKLEQVSQAPLGTSHSSGELAPAPSFSLLAPARVRAGLALALPSSGQPLKLDEMSFGGEVGNSRRAKSHLPHEQVRGLRGF